MGNGNITLKKWKENHHKISAGPIWLYSAPSTGIYALLAKLVMDCTKRVKDQSRPGITRSGEILSA